jgi:alpha-1,6-mannosyltransferase
MTVANPDPGPSRPTVPLVGWASVGLAGSTLLTLAGSRLSDRRVHWWFRPLIGSPAIDRAAFYVGIVILVVGWLGLSRLASDHAARPRPVSAVALLWCLPLLLGAPLFSHDIYSYYAQGTLAHLGLSPYHAPPSALGPLGHRHVLQAVDPFWRRATAPYGPLFLGVISLIAGLTGNHLIVAVLATRLFDFVGWVLLAVFVPRLARSTGCDPTRASWLAVASPLVLLQLVAPGHNDLLMAGVMVAGVAVALDGQPLLGVVICALATTIKLPAVAAVAFIAVAWMRAQDGWRGSIRVGAASAAAAVATAGAVTLITGMGLGWISSGLFSTPARVHLAITPATAVSYTVAHLLGGVTYGEVDSVLRSVLVVGALIVALVLLARVRWRTLVPCLGLALAAFWIGGPALWPWYLSWSLVLLAAWRTSQASRVLAAAVVVGSFLVKPDGILLLSFGASPVLAAFWLLVAVLAWLAWRRRAAHRSQSEYADSVGHTRSAMTW